MKKNEIRTIGVLGEITLDTQSKILRKSANEYEELQREVNFILAEVLHGGVSFQVAGGYIYAFITYKVEVVG